MPAIVPYSPDAESRRTRGDMRDMREAVCAGCGYGWWAPVIGRCPRCGATGAHVVMAKQIQAPRV